MILSKERKEKVKLFVLLVVVFSVAGFGFKYGLNHYITKREHGVTTRVLDNWKPSSYTEADLERAKNVAISFFSVYLEQNQEEVKKHATPTFYSVLEREYEAPRRNKQILSHIIEKVGCQRAQNKVVCYITATIENQSNHQQREETYEMMVVPQGDQWFVDEVNIRGTFE